MSESHDVERLLELQESLFLRLDAMSQRQSSFIESQDTDALLEILAERQGVIDQIARTSASLEPYRASWDAVMGGLDEAGKHRVRRRLDALSAVAERIAQRDEADRRLLEDRRDAVSGELLQINRGRGALAAYKTGGHSGPRMRDEEA